MFAIDDSALNLFIGNYYKLVAMVFNSNINLVCIMFRSPLCSKQSQILVHNQLCRITATLELNLEVFAETTSPFAKNVSKLNVQAVIFYRKTMENVLSNIIKNHGN